jgi:mannosyltransferase OCH1-like enzyme/tetratricopeptide (TPR) repeat protein
MLDRLKAMQMKGKLEEAEASFSRIISTAPDQFYAWLGRGYCAILKEDFDSASRAFGTASAVCPDDDNAAFECAAALIVAGDKASARDVLAARPEGVRQQLALGDWEERHGSVDAALLHYEAAHGLDPQAEAPLQKMIDLHRGRQAFAAAHDVTDRLAAIASLPKAKLWSQRARIHSAAGNPAAAIEALRTATGLAPDGDQIAIDLARELQRIYRNDEAYTVLAARPATYDVLRAIGDLEMARRNLSSALSCAEAAHEMQPSKSEPLAQIARIHADQGQYQAAYGAAAKIEAIGPEHRLASLRSRLATARLAGDESGALGILRQIVVQQPHHAGVMVELARQYRLMGDATRAREVVNAALKLAEHNVAALTELGEQALITDNREAALTFFRQVLQLAPEAVRHHLRVASLLYDANRLDEAEAALASAEGRFGLTAELWGQRVRMLQDSGQVAEALEEIRKAQAAYPANHGVWRHRFSLELRLSSLEEARRCFDHAPVTTCSEEAQVLYARALLARRENEDHRAVELCEAALRARPNDRGILIQLFELYLIGGDVEKASGCHVHIGKLEAGGRRFRRTTTNASQSQRGQLLNEFSLDREANTEIRVAKTLAITDQVEALLNMIRKRPGSIPTAISLLVALRRGSLFKRRAHLESSCVKPIPRVIGQFWDDVNPPADLLDLSESWQTFNPDHRHMLFDETRARAYLAAHFHRAVLTAYLRCGDATTKADLFRLAFLLREGGVWADMDDRCLAPLSAIIPPQAEAFFWQESAGTLCNNLMAATPGHPIFLRALGSAVQAINRGDRDKVWMLTGPGLITRVFAYEMAEKGEEWPEWLNQVTVLGEFELHPLVAVHCRTSHKRAGKHWSKTAFVATRMVPSDLPPADAEMSVQQSRPG